MAPEQFPRLNMFAISKVLMENGIGPFVLAGVPTSGTSGTLVGFAGPGALLIDITNKNLYQNTNTKASPTWTKVANDVTDLALAQAKIIIGNSSGVAAAQSLGGDATITDGGTLTVGAVVNGARTANVADANIIGGTPVVHRVDVPAGTTGNVDVVLTHKTRVIDAFLIKRVAAGGGAGTITVNNGATAITDAMSIDIADKAIARALTIDDAAYEIAAAGTLRIVRTRSASTDETCTVYVIGLRVA